MKSSHPKTLFVSLFMLLTSLPLLASHITAGGITIKYVGPGIGPGSSQYYLEAWILRDCNGVQNTLTAQPVTAECSGQTTSTFTLPHLAFIAPTPIPFGGPYTGVLSNAGTTQFVAEEVSDLCDNILDPLTSPISNCRGQSGNEGHLRYKYSGIITLPHCNAWEIGFAPVCCRNTANGNTNSGGNYTKLLFDNLNFKQNSVVNTSQNKHPIRSVCLGSAHKISYSYPDPDGDVLKYELTCALQNKTTCATYTGTFSGTRPVNGASMDSITGILSFNPSSTGKRYITYWVKEYETCTGKWKSQVLNDARIDIRVCAPVNSDPAPTGIAALQGDGATRNSASSMSVKQGSWVTFQDTIYEYDTTSMDTLVIESDIQKVFAGATFSVTPLGRYKAVAKFGFTAFKQGNQDPVITLRVSDGRCAIPARNAMAYQIQIQPDINFHGSRDTLRHCVGDTLSLTAYGSYHLTWRSLSGDPLIFTGPNQNIFFDTIPNVDTNLRARVSFQNPTVLEISGKAQSCGSSGVQRTSKDTITIFPAPAFTIQVPADTTVCASGNGYLGYVNTSNSQLQYAYTWSPANRVTNGNTATPLLSDSTTTYAVTVTSSGGCERTASFDSWGLKALTGLKVWADDSVLCAQQPTQLRSNYYSGSSFFDPVDYSNTKQLITSGTTGTTNTTNGGFSDWPCPFGQSEPGARQQYLFRASELTTMGFRANEIIRSIAFHVADRSNVGTIQQYKIGFKQVADTALTSWNSGASTVFNPKNIALVDGWNTLELDTGFYWDGSSNLLIDICYYNNTFSNPKNNPLVSHQTTPFSSTLTANGNRPMCLDQTLALSMPNNRPVIRFGVNQSVYGEHLEFKWTPATGLSADTVSEPIASPTSNQRYVLTLSYDGGYCEDTASAQVLVSPDPQFSTGPDTTICDGQALTLHSQVSQTVPGPFTYAWFPASFLDDSTKAQPIISPVPTGVYHFVARLTDPLGCEYWDTTIVTGSASPVANISTFGPFCEKDSINLLQSGASGTFYGYAVDSTSGNFNAADLKFQVTQNHNDTSTIFFTSTGPNGCTKDTSFVVTVMAPFDTTYTGSLRHCDNDAPVLLQTRHPGGTWSGAHVNGNHFDPSAAGAGVHTVRVDSNGFCGNSANYQMTVYASPLRTVPVQVLGCTGSPAVIDAGNAGSTYQWSNGKTQKIITETQSGTLQLITTNGDGCSRVDTVDVVIEQLCLGLTGTSAKAQHVRIYPNPANDVVNIDIPGPLLGEMQLQLFNLTGQKVRQDLLPPSSEDKAVQWNISELPSGSYWLVITSANQSVGYPIVIQAQ